MLTGWYDHKKANYEWRSSFKHSHPQVILRINQKLSAARAEALNEQRITAFFADAKNVFDKVGLHHHPTCVYNCDETGLLTVPNSTGRAISQRGTMTVQKVFVGEY